MSGNGKQFSGFSSFWYLSLILSNLVVYSSLNEPELLTLIAQSGNLGWQKQVDYDYDFWPTDFKVDVVEKLVDEQSDSSP